VPQAPHLWDLLPNHFGWHWVALGRPPANVSKAKKKQAAYDERIRNAIEGKFGFFKHRFSLARIMTKLENTSRTAIAILPDD
jgi:transposase, IS5 family